MSRGGGGGLFRQAIKLNSQQLTLLQETMLEQTRTRTNETYSDFLQDLIQKGVISEETIVDASEPVDYLFRDTTAKSFGGGPPPPPPTHLEKAEQVAKAMGGVALGAPRRGCSRLAAAPPVTLWQKREVEKS